MNKSKAVFISCNQAFYEHVLELLDRLNIRGMTSWEQVKGRGSFTGEPHYGTHTWPTLNSAMLTIVPEDKVEILLDGLRKLDQRAEQQGLRAFVWDITGGL
ncbi:PG0541 family transporter-associated protein [Porphyromonas cangingivalis]|uniref:Nitrogen regulatory protein P-II family n=1 Tax=Porphyromonas cangingivalis TaxID=36874 RepID=A0A0A2EGZ0_PORCN|nr:PG0541 family transporter-associated protein [Porphyromonas cangingivalis]KGN78136.1 hypothetical protein HQ35_10650 [Porphyromonas cangingivalis]SJZ44142.1 hypothetical protein SAMN02745205_00814 [Porphyromonas cangingivalis]VEJ02515.1 Uncharacterised protein [Porphyromonas cangingivalis]